MTLRSCMGGIVAATVFTGCLASPAPRARAVPPDMLHIGGFAHTTAFERSGKPTPTLSNTPAPKREDNHQAARSGVFVAGLVLLAAGAAGTIAFAASGRVMQNKLDDGYSNGSLTRSDEDKFERRGEIFNAAAVTSGAVGLAGLVMTAVTLGLDFTHCGKLTRRKDCQR